MRRFFARAAGARRVKLQPNDPRTLWLATGAVLAAVAVAGFALAETGRRAALGQYFLLDRPHNLVHAVLAVASLALAFAPLPETTSRRVALGFGILYLGLAVIGAFSANLFGYGTRLGTTANARLHLEMGENLLHFALGAYAAYVGTHGPQEN